MLHGLSAELYRHIHFACIFGYRGVGNGCLGSVVVHYGESLAQTRPILRREIVLSKMPDPLNPQSKGLVFLRIAVAYNCHIESKTVLSYTEVIVWHYRLTSDMTLLAPEISPAV